MSAPVSRVVIIRHGESHANVGRLITGHSTCRGLSDHGRRQVAALRDRLLASQELPEPTAVYTSVLARAVETAEILAPALGPAPARAECAWCEIHPGDAEGLTFPEFEAKADGGLRRDDPDHRPFPGMETMAEFNDRVGARLQQVARDHPGERVVVVGHGGTMSASLVALGGIPAERVWSFTSPPSNTSMMEWHHDDEGWRLARYNDDSHLAAFDTG